jgi:hypothetical protein
MDENYGLNLLFSQIFTTSGPLMIKKIDLLDCIVIMIADVSDLM